MLELVRSLIAAAAISHGVSPAAMDCLAYKESTWGIHSRNLYQLQSPGELDHFYRDGFTDPFDFSQQADFVAQQIHDGNTLPWRNTWPVCRYL